MIKRGATHDNPTPWIHGVMQIFALFMFLGCLTSLLVPESKSARLEELAGEDEDVYELQFRSQFYTGSERSPRGSTLSGRGSALGSRGVNDPTHGRERGRARTGTERWWKLR
jgi:PHS family inorganic phosphate transporter-like MFS transporter